MGFLNHAVCRDHPVAVPTGRAPNIAVSQAQYLTESLRLVHVGYEDALEAFQIPAAK
jgi:hypothetical protein